MRADLTTPNSAPTVWRTLPSATPPEGSRYTVRLLATDGDRLLFNRTEFSFYDHSFHNELFTIEPDGTNTSVGSLPANPERILEAAFSPDGATIAISGDTPAPGRNPYRCRQTTLTIAALRSDGKTTTIPLTEDCTTSSRIRWDAHSGVSIALTQRTENADLKAGQTTRWQYRSGTWSRTDNPIVDGAVTATGTTLELAQPSTESAHTLYRTGIKLAEGVNALATP